MILNGAEAVLTFSENTVRKERVPKPYRHAELDALLRARRNRKEAKVLSNAPVRVPKLLAHDTFSLTMERIDGERLRDMLNAASAERYGAALGSLIAQLHRANLIHGDLTTSNVLVNTADKLVLIDFGLSQTSTRPSDKAVDLHVLRETLRGTHPTIAEQCWGAFAQTYADTAVLAALSAVEQRGRNKRH